MSHASDDLRDLLRALAATLSLDLEEQLAALEERLVERIALRVVDELDRREWTVAAPRARMTSPRAIASAVDNDADSTSRRLDHGERHLTPRGGRRS